MTPDDRTLQETYLEVGSGHRLYVQDWGNAKASLPIIFLHGGPGGGCNDGHKGYFDPALQRVIFFDQRGAGRSSPSGSLKDNTTASLVEDIKRVAEYCGIKKFILTGGSWGSCLALAYGLAHPGSVAAMVLRGIYTGSQAETDYLDNGGFKMFFPDVWERYLNRTPKKWRDNPNAYHYRQLASNKPQAVKASAYAYSELEGSLLTLDDRHTPQKFDEFNPEAMKIELHFLANGCFMPDRHILNNAHKLTMPVWLVQGRYDMVCPPATAYELAKRLPNGRLIWTTAGHSGSDRPTMDVMRALLLELTREAA